MIKKNMIHIFWYSTFFVKLARYMKFQKLNKQLIIIFTSCCCHSILPRMRGKKVMRALFKSNVLLHQFLKKLLMRMFVAAIQTCICNGEERTYIYFAKSVIRFLYTGLLHLNTKSGHVQYQNDTFQNKVCNFSQISAVQSHMFLSHEIQRCYVSEELDQDPAHFSYD